MKSIIPPLRLSNSLILALLSVIAFGLTTELKAQNPETDSDVDEDVFFLSPFIVETDKDVGYLAGNTLSGSRMNANLKDTAAAISVFTEEFLQDIGATSTEEVIRYSTNTNPDFQQGSSSPTLSFLDAGLFSDTRINVRGILASRTVDFFDTSVPTDSYNLARADLSSGPNSILFGFANAGGIFNSATKDAEFSRTHGSVGLQGGSWDRFRANLDLNLVVLKDQAAVRFMALREDTNGWRTWDYQTQDRWTLAAHLRPLPQTTLRFSYEEVELSQSSQKPFGFDDGLSAYATGPLAGQPIDNRKVSIWKEDRVNGTSGIGPLYVYFPQSERFFRNFHTTNGATLLKTEAISNGFGTLNGEQVPVFREDGIGSIFNNTLLPSSPNELGIPFMPPEYGTGGPGAVRDADFSRLLLRAEQQIGKHSSIELAYNSESADGFAQVPNEMTVHIDAFAYLPSPENINEATENPHFGRLYVQNGWWGSSEKTEREVFRATLSHNLDLGQYGLHRIAAFYETSEEDSTSIGGPLAYFREDGQPLDALAADQKRPDLWRNTVRVRNYFDTNDYSTYHAYFPTTLPPLENDGGGNVSMRWTASGLDGSTSVRRSLRSIDSYMAATQSYLLEDRLVLTAGYRYDSIAFDIFGEERVEAGDPDIAAGRYVVGERRITDEIVSTDEFISRTFTAGLVYHITPQVSLFYNQASNTGPSQLHRRILSDEFDEDGAPLSSGEIPPLSDGKGRDAGIILDLLEGKVFARLTYFETSQENETSIRAGRIQSVNNSILENLYRPVDASGNQLPDSTGLLISEETFNRRTLLAEDLLSDTESSGVELELKLNLQKGWSSTISYSYTDLKRSNIYPRFDAWFERAESFYSQFYNGVTINGETLYFSETGFLTPEPGDALRERVEDMVRTVENIRNVEAFGFNNRPHKINFFTRYEFQEGFLRKFFIGGGMRWQSANRIQRELIGQDENGGDLLGDRVLKGNEIWQTDLLLGYVWDMRNFQIFGARNTWMRLQLNVYNIFDNDDPNIIRYARVEDADQLGFIWKQSYQKPREFRVSVTFNF